MDLIPQTPPPVNPTLWSPVPTPLPQKWIEISERLARGARGKPRPYIMETKYDARRVGNLLRSWGLPWDVVMAGYLWEYDKEEIRSYQLSDTERVIGHMLHTTTYLGNIKNDILPPLLTPPFDDLGGLLIAVAIYYEAFRMLKKLSNNELLHRTLHSDIERTRRTLISIAKRLGMWDFKREVEDVTEQLLNPSKFAEMSEEYERILKQDEGVLEDTRQWLIDTYYKTTGDPIMILCNACSIGGLKRRIQDAYIAQLSEEGRLRGFDLVTFETIVPTVKECYAALGILSQLGVIQQMNDQISTPKTNGFSRIILDLQLERQGPFTQSLKWVEGQTLLCKIQIATPAMQAVTRFGVLYPDYYKLYAEPIRKEAGTHVSLAHVWQNESGTIFPTLYKNITTSHHGADNKSPIIVYESKSRKPIALKKGATVLDFAYTLDQSIGAHAVYALVNNRNAPLYRILDADDIIEIITSTEIQAKESWLQPGYATSSAVRKQIRKSLHDRRGYKLLSQELERYHHILPPEVLEEHLSTLVKQHSLGTVQEYLERLDPTEEMIYTPFWAAQEIMQRLADHNGGLMSLDGRTNWVPVIDTQLREDKRYFHQQRLCNICQPNYPYDRKIMGRIRKRDHMLVVHKDSCPSLLEHPNSSGSSLLPMTWQRQPMFRVTFYIAAQDRRGLVLDLVRLLRRHYCDLLSINAEARTKYGEARIRFTIEAHSYTEVIDIWQALYRIDNVTKADLDASATPLQVYDHLQQLRQQKESIPQLSLSEFLEEPLAPESRSVMLENPFDISHPPTPNMFFGRSAEIEKMKRELCDAPRGRALVLHGPRRSGKTSICTNFLENQIQPPFWGVLFSLLSYVEHDEETILEKIADAISEQFRKQLHQSGPSWEDFHDTDPQDHFRKFLEYCLDQTPHSRLILILDEFGGAIESHKRRILHDRFFPFWKELMDRISQLSLVFVLPTSSHNWLTSKKFNNVFSFAGTLPLEFLDTNSARELLVDPLQEQGIQVISTTAALAVKLTGGNPYYMALIGRELISYLNREINQQRITDRDLRLITDQLIQPGTHQYFDYLRGELQSEIEMRLVQGLVEITSRTRESKVQFKRLASWLNLSPSVARRHLDRLRDGLILNEIGSLSNPYYSFKIELIRKWLTRNQWFFLNERRG
jgi:(p)ppGpp synthase/HD superfamily hydrolase/DNA-binding transcriptional ArsR family regulator